MKYKHLKPVLSFILFVSLYFYSSSPLSAQPTADERANAISAEIMSPYCPGLLLRDCPSEKATELKETIKQKIITEDLSREQIITWLENEFGSKIYSVPKMKGFGILGWILPFVFLFVGGGAIYLWTKKNNSGE